jgi:hypothetical protein
MITSCLSSEPGKVFTKHGYLLPYQDLLIEDQIGNKPLALSAILVKHSHLLSFITLGHQIAALLCDFTTWQNYGNDRVNLRQL